MFRQQGQQCGEIFRVQLQQRRSLAIRQSFDAFDDREDFAAAEAMTSLGFDERGPLVILARDETPCEPVFDAPLPRWRPSPE